MPDTIAVYGATGGLGQLVVRDLIRRGARIKAGGRDAEKLDTTEALQAPGIERIAAPITETAALARLLDDASVVVNVARLAPADTDRLITAALDAGVHYIDAAGEQAYIGQLFASRNDTATRQGVAVVPACGFDYALGDCLAHIVAVDRQPAREVVVAYAIAGSDVSANSLQFAAETPAGAEVRFENGTWVPAGLEILRRRIDFPPPFGAQTMARYAAGEVLTVPRHADTRRVTTLITASSLVPDARLVPLFPYLRPAVALMRRTPARHLLGLAARLKRSATGGTDQAAGGDVTEPPHFAIVAEVTSSNGQTRRGVVEGGSFHDVTAATLGFVATQLAAPSFVGRGVLPQAVAVDAAALLDDLGHLGVRWSAQSDG